MREYHIVHKKEIYYLSYIVAILCIALFGYHYFRGIEIADQPAKVAYEMQQRIGTVTVTASNK